ncbi:hypothetical protein SCUP515_10712 [Seiridium cupressi]
MGVLRYNRCSTMENARQAWTASRTSEPQMCHSVKSGAITKPRTRHAMPQQQHRYSLRKTVKTSREARDASPELPTWVRRGTRDKAVKINSDDAQKKTIKIKLVGRWAQPQTPSPTHRTPTSSPDHDQDSIVDSPAPLGVNHHARFFSNEVEAIRPWLNSTSL